MYKMFVDSTVFYPRKIENIYTCTFFYVVMNEVKITIQKICVDFYGHYKYIMTQERNYKGKGLNFHLKDCMISSICI